MAAPPAEPHTIIQGWVGVSLVEKLRANAKAEGCSVSSLVRDTLEESFSTAEKADDAPASEGFLTPRRSGAGHEGD